MPARSRRAVGVGSEVRASGVRTEQGCDVGRLVGRQGGALKVLSCLEFPAPTGDKHLSLKHKVDAQVIEDLSRDVLGRLVFMTDRNTWPTEHIIRACRGQAHVEAVFVHLKDPLCT